MFAGSDGERGGEVMLGGRRKLRVGVVRRRGMTLVEALVVVGVLLILAGLLLPALGRVRATVRRLRCAANLRELAVATIQYHDAMGCMPPTDLSWWGYVRTGVSGRPAHRHYSPQSHLLPWLGEESLYNAINFTLDGFTVIPYLKDTYAFRANLTVLESRVGVFVCPADGEAREGPCLSYRGNMGLLDTFATRRGWPESGHGMFRLPPITFAEVTDGLSVTAMYGERVVGRGRVESSGEGVDGMRRGMLRVSTGGDVPRRADEWAGVCAVASGAQTRLGLVDWLAGRYWLPTSGRFALYNHVLIPNARVYDCYLQYDWGAFSARSVHAGGVVNVAFGDGHVKPIPSSIDLKVWRALGTRDGGELVSEEW